jgi:hypothetical protein
VDGDSSSDGEESWEHDVVSTVVAATTSVARRRREHGTTGRDTKGKGLS